MMTSVYGKSARRSFFGALSISTAMAGVFLAPGTAFAGCSPNPAQSTGTTICSDTETGGLVVSADGANVVVNENVLVSATGNRSILVTTLPTASPYYYYATSNSTLAINGTVTNGTGSAILVTTGQLGPYDSFSLQTKSTITVGQTGVISGPTGIDLTVGGGSYNSRSEVTLVNGGVISSSNGGYALRGNADASARFASITNLASGTIGAISGQVGALDNQGLIDGGALSAYADATGYLAYYGQGTVVNSGTMRSNSSTATLAFVRDYNPNTYVENSGLIVNTGSGLAIGGKTRLSVLNRANGVITGNGTAIGASFLELINEGTINGGQAVAATTINFTNRGTINGSIVSDNSNRYNSSLIDNVGGTINGDVLLGESDDVFIGDADNLDSPIGTINGVLNAGGGTDSLRLTFAEDKTFDSQVTLPQSIERLDLWIAKGATVTLGAGYAGTSQIAVGGGISYLYDEKDQFVNLGSIVTQGTALASTGSGGIGVTNSGTISATLASPTDFAVSLSDVSRFANSGAITAIGGNGVRADASGAWSNSGTISATGTAVSGTYKIENSGTIRSSGGIGLDLNYSYNGGSRNSGTIEGAQIGARLWVSTLNNSGTITSPNIGVLFNTNTTVNNLAGGVINGGMKSDADSYNSGGATIRNAGTINGNVDFGTSPYSEWSGNIFVAGRGGVVNGNVRLGNGGDIFATLLQNDGPGEFAGVTGTVSGSGNETLRYIVDRDASATLGLRGIFTNLSYDLSNGARLTLTSPTVFGGLGFAGTGTVDLTADLAGNGNVPLLDLAKNSVQLAEDGTILPTSLTVTSHGTLSLTHDANNYYYAAVQLNNGSTFTNTGTISVKDLAAPGSYYDAQIAAISGVKGSKIVNSGTINLDGAIGLSGSEYNSGYFANIVNNGTISQIAGGASSVGVSGMVYLTNSGTIVTGGNALKLRGGQVVNSGTIRSTGAAAIVNDSYYSSVTVINQAGGTIAGGAGFNAIALTSGGNLANAGTITGNVSLGGSGYYGSSSFINRGGTLNGDLRLSEGDDIFVALNGENGVTGSINAGAGTDTYVRSVNSNATFDLNILGALPTSFERVGLGAIGADTVMTLNASSGGFSGPLLLIGDGSIVNTANLTRQTGVYSELKLGLAHGGSVDDGSDALFSSLSKLSFTNRGTIAQSISGYVRSFVNEGTIQAPLTTIINIFADDANGFVFRNSGKITTSAPTNPDYYYSPGVVISSSVDPDQGIAQAVVENSGTIVRDMSVTLNARDFRWSNSGRIEGNGYGGSVALNVGTQNYPYGQSFTADRVTINNSGTLTAGLTGDLVARVVDITNSGTIGTSLGGNALYVGQYATVETSTQSEQIRLAEQQSLNFTNSGTINGKVDVSASAPKMDVTNSGTIISDPAHNAYLADEALFSLGLTSKSSQTLNFTNSATIATSAASGSGLQIYSSTSSKENWAYGVGVSGDPVAGGPTASISVINSGTIRADGGAIYQPSEPNYYPWYPPYPQALYGLAALDVTVNSEGTGSVAIVNRAGGIISAKGVTDSSGASDELAAQLANIGSTAIRVAADAVSLDNSGTIEGLAGGQVPADLVYEDFPLPVGYMAGAVQTFGSVDTVFNRASGVIIGSVDLGAKDDLLVNAGTIRGDVFLGEGNDSMVHAISGTLTGTVDGGAGTDGLIIDITGGGLLDAALMNRFVNFETEVISGTGTITTNGRFAQDSLYLRDANLTLAAGQTLETASDVALVFTGGTNSLINLGTIKGTLDLSHGTNRVVNQGQISGPVTFGAADDQLIIGSGGSVTGPVDGGAGNDMLILATGGSAATPVELTLSTVTGFDRTRQEAGVIALSGSFGTGSLDIIGGRLIGRTGSTLTAPSITVASGATFGSAGTVNGNIAVNGILSPGASPGTMTVNGNVALASGSQTLFEMTPTVSDALVVNGGITIASGATLTITGTRPLTPGLTYKLLSATNGISGSFTTIDKASTVLGFLRQTANSIDLLGQFVLSPGASPQVVRTVDYVNGLLIGGTATSGLIDNVPLLLNGAGNADPQAFAKLSGESYASATQIGVENGLAISAALRSANRVTPGEGQGLFSFGQTLGGWRSLPGSFATGVARANVSTRGALAGIGIGTADVSVGAFVGYIDARQQIGALDARTDANGVIAGLTGRVATRGFDLLASITYDGSAADTKRSLPGGASATAHYRLRGWTGDLLLGYALDIGKGWALRPEIGFTHIATRRGGVSEIGGGAFGLTVDGRNSRASFVSGAFTLKGTGEGVIHPWLSAGVRHQLSGKTGYAQTAFAGVTPRLTTIGAGRDATLATVSAGASVAVGARTSLFFGLNSEFGADSSGQGANAGIRVAF